MFTIREFCNESFEPLSLPSFEEATEKAHSLLTKALGDPVYTIFNSKGEHVATVTSRRIKAYFEKQRWVNGHIDPVDTVAFDATDYVLLLEYEDIKALEDLRESTDILGQAHIFWDGPHDVEVVDNICEFFGIEDLKDLTVDVLEYAREVFKPEPRLERTVEVVVRVPVKLPAGYDTEHLINHLKVRCEVEPSAEGKVLVGSPDAYRLNYVD